MHVYRHRLPAVRVPAGSTRFQDRRPLNGPVPNGKPDDKMIAANIFPVLFNRPTKLRIFRPYYTGSMQYILNCNICSALDTIAFLY